MNESRYLRVTEILAPFSGLQHIDKHILSRAAERGTKVHRICEAIVEGLGEWNVDDETRGYVHSFKKWWEKGHRVHCIEKRFFCSELMITGQVDLILEGPEGLIILDIKTPQKPSKTWPLQGSAYAYMARKEGYDIKGIHFLRLDKEGKNPTLYVYDDQFEMFKKCLDVFNHFFKRKTDGITNSNHV